MQHQAVGIQQTTTTTNPQPDPTLLGRRKRSLRILGKIEVTLSALCFIISVIIIAAVRSLRGVTIGEGMWLSLLPLTAGILGIVAGGSRSNRCTIQAHMALAIISTMNTFILLAISIHFNLWSFFSTGGYRILMALTTIMAFTNFICLIVSSSYACMLSPSCGGCCGGDQTQVVTTTSAQSPVVFVQQSGQVQQQGYALGQVQQQGYAPGQVQQPGYVQQTGYTQQQTFSKVPPPGTENAAAPPGYSALPTAAPVMSNAALPPPPTFPV